jgi:hypothetical protein
MCESFATLSGEHSFDNQWNFRFNGSEVALLVRLETQTTGTKANGWPRRSPVRVLNAVLSICWWEDCSEGHHESTESFHEDRDQFNRLFADELGRATAVLGAPLLRGKDRDGAAHEHALWRGDTGLLVLQQSAYDPQFGLDINYWVRPWRGSDPQPATPFLDWLMSAPSPQ